MTPETRALPKPRSLAAPVLFRETELERALEALRKKRSLLIIGEAGVGKTAFLIELAARAKKEAICTIKSTSTGEVMVGTRYLGEWQTNVRDLIDLAKERKQVLYFTDIWNVATAGRSSQSQENFWDIMEPEISAQKLRLIGELSADILAKADLPQSFLPRFEKILLEPLTPEQIGGVLKKACETKHLVLDKPAFRRVQQLAGVLPGAKAGPGPGLKLLTQLADYQKAKADINETEALSQRFVEKVFAVHHGLPLFIVSHEEVKPAREIEAWFRERIIGQEQGIAALVEAITLFKAGLRDPKKPIGTFLFIGPTGVGKTELCRALATFLFGSENRLLRFDMSEFKDYNAFEMLVGGPRSGTKGARLLDPVEAQPYQVILFDELEKAHPNIWDLMLQLLDEGRLAGPEGKTVDFTNTILIATSNVGAAALSKPTIGFAHDAQPGPSMDEEASRAALEAYFRPEFLNRFQHIVQFHPLNTAQIRAVVTKELRQLLNREGLAERDLVVEVEPAAIDGLITHGYDPKYGVRGIKREIQRRLILPIATTLMEKKVEPGSILKVSWNDARPLVRPVETDQTRLRRREAREQLASQKNQAQERASLSTQKTHLTRLQEQFEQLTQQSDEKALRDRVAEIDRERKDHLFWNDPVLASRRIAQQARALPALERLDRLRDSLEELGASLTSETPTKRALEMSARKLEALDGRLNAAHRDLVLLKDGGDRDALVEISPIGKSTAAVTWLFQLYTKWADWRGLKTEIIREPMKSMEPILLAFTGHYPFGYLSLEAGHHRLREKETHAVAKVRVIAWEDDEEGAGDALTPLGPCEALKKKGLLGGRVRSRVSSEDGSLILQNARNLSDNRDLARSILPSWHMALPESDTVIRRYDESPFHLKDYLTGLESSKADCLKPEAFHDLLCQRIESAAS